MNKETKKQEAIRLVYGEHWETIKDYVDDNGWIEGGKGEDPEPLFDPWIGMLEEHEIQNKYRPEPLKGIETNNSWISINSEDDLPKEEFELYFVSGPNFSIHQCIYHDGIKSYWLDKITHWQAIIKPQKPIY